MTRLTVHTAASAPEGSRGFIDTVITNNGFLPNLIGVLSGAPVALETYLPVSGINARASLTLQEREVVQITAAAIHGCGFCVAGHTAIATKKAQLDAAVVKAIRATGTIPDARLDAVAQFTKAVIATRGNVADADLDAFLAAGFTQQAALEVVLGVSLATLCNFANNLGQSELNPELAPFAWEGVAPATAGA